MQDDRLRGSLGYALVRAFRTVNRTSNRALAPFGLSAEQAHILLVLWLDGPLKIGDLQRELALSSGTLTGAVDRMAQAGLVRRVRDPSDGRVWRIESAPFDSKKKRAIERALEGIEDGAFAVLSARERRDLHAMLQKIAEREAE
jgi:MarR family 2-MHQ and catechol resistance regulon transcriptional repressor